MIERCRGWCHFHGSRVVFRRRAAAVHAASRFRLYAEEARPPGDYQHAVRADARFVERRFVSVQQRVATGFTAAARRSDDAAVTRQLDREFLLSASLVSTRKTIRVYTGTSCWECGIAMVLKKEAKAPVKTIVHGSLFHASDEVTVATVAMEGTDFIVTVTEDKRQLRKLKLEPAVPELHTRVSNDFVPVAKNGSFLAFVNPHRTVYSVFSLITSEHVNNECLCSHMA